MLHVTPSSRNRRWKDSLVYWLAAAIGVMQQRLCADISPRHKDHPEISLSGHLPAVGANQRLAPTQSLHLT